MYIFCLAILFAILLSAKFSVSAGVGVCRWTIYDRSVRIEVYFWRFLNNPPNSDSVAEAMTLRMMLHSTCMGPFYWGIAYIRVFLGSQA